MLNRVEQIRDYEFIEFTIGTPFGLSISKDGRIHQLELTGRFKVNDVVGTKVAALSGIGIAALPRFIVADEVKKKQLVPLLTDYQFPGFSVYAVYPSRQWMPAKLKVFLDYLKHHGD